MKKNFLLAKIRTMLFVCIVALCFLTVSCQKPEEPKKEDIKKETSDAKPMATSTAKSDSKAAPISPLERARGKVVKGEDGEPVLKWPDLKKQPYLDEVFPVVDKLPEGVEFLDRKEGIAKLPDTEERKKIREWISKEPYTDEAGENKLFALKNTKGSCIVEIGGYFNDKKEREDWVRSIDPESGKVLWKYDEPGLTSLDAEVMLAKEADVFILNGLKYYNESKTSTPDSQIGIKVFSCKKGFLWEYMKSTKEAGYGIASIISADGKKVIAGIKTGQEIESFNINGNSTWKFEGKDSRYELQAIYMSQDGKYIFADFGDPKHRRKGMCCFLYRLFEMDTGQEMWAKRGYTTLGDKNALVLSNSSYSASKEGLMTGVWLMDYRYFSFWEKDKDHRRNPHNNMLVLITKKGDAFAFRIETFGFAFSEDGRYLAADGRYYDLNQLLE